jgi:hypothetical protein
MTSLRAMAPVAPLEEAILEWANLFPRHTGLSVTIWVGPRGGARHAPRIKVWPEPGDRMRIDGAASMLIADPPKLVRGKLAPEIEAQAASWVLLNREPLLDYWNGLIDTFDLQSRLKKI